MSKKQAHPSHWMALHVHCGLGQLSPLPNSGDDVWVAAKHCGRANQSRISNVNFLTVSEVNSNVLKF